MSLDGYTIDLTCAVSHCCPKAKGNGNGRSVLLVV